MSAAQYNVGLLVGRAFSLAHHDPGLQRREEASAELYALADGDRLAIELAQARFREFLAGPSPSRTDRRALRLLTGALQQVSTTAAA